MLHHLLNYGYVYLLPLFFSAILGLFKFRREWPTPYKWFVILLVISIATETFAIYWKWYMYNMFNWTYTKNNFWIYNIFITIRLGFLLAIFHQILDAPRIKKTIRYAGAVLVLFGLLDYIFIQGPYQYNTYSAIFAHIPIIILCLFYFKQLLDAPTIIVLHKDPMFWMALGTFIYHAASLPFLIMLNFLNMQQSSLSLLFLPINDTLNLVMCSFYLISTLCNPRSTRLY